MGRPLKKIQGEALGHFLMEEFIAFAKEWPNKNDLDNWAVTFSDKGYPIVGRSHVLALLFRAAAIPDQLSNPEMNRLLVVLYKRSPDLFLALLTRLRERISAASPHRRLILFGNETNSTPKELAAKLAETVEQGTIKAERRKIRKTVDRMSELKNAAHQELENKRDTGERFAIIINRKTRKNNKVTKRR